VRGKLVFQIYALVACFAAVLGFTFKVAELGFGVTQTYVFEQARGTQKEEMMQSDEVFLDRISWPKQKPLPGKEELQKIKWEFLKAWELEEKRRGNADIVKAGFEAIALAVLFGLHWLLARRLQKAVET